MADAGNGSGAGIVMLTITERVPGNYKIYLVWPQGVGIRIDLLLTDPDGEQESDVIEWVADQDYPLRDALVAIINAVDALTHWRAGVIGSEISIGTASDDYTGEVSVLLTGQ